MLRAAPAARIVNVFSGLGSLEINTDPDSPFYGVKPLGYNASKAALNMFTLNLAWELRDTKAKVNSVCPGYAATDLNNHSGPGTASDGAIAIVKYAQVGRDGPYCRLFFIKTARTAGSWRLFPNSKRVGTYVLRSL